MLPKAAHKHVAATTAASGIPVSLRIDEFTKMMYAMVTNVVHPARISVRQLVFRLANSKYRSQRSLMGVQRYHATRRAPRRKRGTAYGFPGPQSSPKNRTLKPGNSLAVPFFWGDYSTHAGATTAHTLEPMPV